MDNKNVFVAIALSMSVLLFWGAFVDTPKPKSQNQINKNIDTKDLAKNEITPNINPEKLITKVSRKDALVKDDRILIENKKIQGSISLKGAIFDDLSFKNYKKKLDSDEKVIFLNPKETGDGYFIETGWTSLGNKVNVPNIETIVPNKVNKSISFNDSVQSSDSSFSDLNDETIKIHDTENIDINDFITIDNDSNNEPVILDIEEL